MNTETRTALTTEPPQTESQTISGGNGLHPTQPQTSTAKPTSKGVKKSFEASQPIETTELEKILHNAQLLVFLNGFSEDKSGNAVPIFTSLNQQELQEALKNSEFAQNLIQQGGFAFITTNGFLITARNTSINPQNFDSGEKIEFGAPIATQHLELSAVNISISDQEAIQHAKEIHERIKEIGLPTEMLTGIEIERTVFIVETDKSSIPYIRQDSLPNQHQEELVASALETAEITRTPNLRALELANALLTLKSHKILIDIYDSDYERVLAPATSVPMAGTILDNELNTYVTYVEAIQEVFLRYIKNYSLDDFVSYVRENWNLVIERARNRLGRNNIPWQSLDEFIEDSQDLAKLWPMNVMHVNTSLVVPDEGVPPKYVAAFHNAFATKLGAFSTILSCSTPIHYNDLYESNDMRFALAGVMPTAYRTAEKIDSSGEMIRQLVYSVLVGTIHTTARARQLANKVVLKHKVGEEEISIEVPMVDAHGISRFRAEMPIVGEGYDLSDHLHEVDKIPNQVSVRIEDLGPSSNADQEIKTIIGAFDKLLVVFTYEALAYGKSIEEYAKDLELPFADLMGHDGRDEFIQIYNQHGPYHPKVRKYIKGLRDFVNYIKQTYNTEDIQELVSAAEKGIERLATVAEENSLKDYFLQQDRKGLITQVKRNMYNDLVAKHMQDGEDEQVAKTNATLEIMRATQTFEVAQALETILLSAPSFDDIDSEYLKLAIPVGSNNQDAVSWLLEKYGDDMRIKQFAHAVLS